MKLEINLVKSNTIDSTIGRYLNRTRANVSNDVEALAAIKQFIKENMATFTAAVRDKLLLTKLENLDGLTISNLRCLCYLLSTYGVDIWYWYVSENEVNEDFPTDEIEYNVLDRDMVIGEFIPTVTKFPQSTKEMKLSKLYNDICEAYDLFSDKVFSGINNPLKIQILAIAELEKVLGVTSSTKTTYINSILSYLHKDIKVITE